ncbi:MAG: ABC transporter ATP-binding protein [Chloroflexi bacterium]|nr:ABC transporter ATP-binding protein [Chloroflexota bacterium]
MPQANGIVIETNNLTHRYGKFVAVQDLNLQVYQGEIFGFLGPNGAGKTTTIRTLLDFIRPSSGSASIFGMDTVRDSVAIRGRIGYLPSELTLLDNWTGLDYVHWLETVRGATNGFVPEAQRLAERLGYDLTRSLKGLSTGMRRQMGLIVALAHKPELLILDEPTTGLDPLMQQVTHEFMREARREGRTVFMSSHNLPEVEAICDRVGIIREGRLEAVETINDLTRVTFRWIEFTFDGTVPVDDFLTLAGVSDISADGTRLRMRISGDTNMDALLKLAARHTVTSLDLEHPSLEEIFLAYYGHRSKEVGR